MTDLARVEKLIAEATEKPWFFDNGIEPGTDVFEAEDIEEFAQIMRDLAPLMLEVVEAAEEYVNGYDSPTRLDESLAFVKSYCAERLPDGTL